MKPLLMLGLLFLSTYSFAQDIITTQEGEEIECKVLELDPPKIKYRLKSQPDGPVRTIFYEDVFMIKYADGTKEIIADKAIAEKGGKQPSIFDYRPFSIAVGPNLLVANGWGVGFWGGIGYEFRPIKFRLVLDGQVGYIVNGGGFIYYGANLSLQYVIPLAEGRVEFAPELGLGMIGQSSYIVPTINLGTALDFRFSDLIGMYIHPRYQIDIVDPPSGAFSFNVGLRFRLGNKKSE